MPGYIEDRWWTKRPDPDTGKKRKTDLYGKGKRYKVAGIPGVRARSFDDGCMKDAKLWLAQAQTDSKRHEFVDPRDGEIRLSEYIELWWAKRNDPVGTAVPMKSKIWNHIVNTSLGVLPMNAIDEDRLGMWLGELRGRGLEETTITVIWNHLSSIFKSAVGKRIPKNPCHEAAELRPDAGGETKARAWTVGEVRAIRSGLAPRYQIIQDLGVLAGLRQAETFGFSPDDIDEDRMVLHLRRQLLWESGSKPYFKLPKGKKERDIPLSPGLLKLLKEHGDSFPAVETTLPWHGPGNGKKKEATVRLLATTWFGNRINPSIYNQKSLKPALAAAGLIAERGEEGWEPSRELMHHRNRHTYASVQLHAGEDPVSVSHWMGHASPEITLRIYAHFMPDRGQRGRSAVDAWLGAA